MKNLTLAKEELYTTDYSLIVVKDNKVIARSKNKGVSGILNLYETKPKTLSNSYIADKIIGRAVAMICDLAEVKKCYTPIISKGAEEILQQAGIEYKAEERVKVIKNRNNTGLCPIEQLTLQVDSSKLGVEKIKDFLNNK